METHNAAGLMGEAREGEWDHVPAPLTLALKGRMIRCHWASYVSCITCPPCLSAKGKLNPDSVSTVQAETAKRASSVPYREGESYRASELMERGSPHVA